MAGHAPGSAQAASMDFRDVLAGIWRRRLAILAGALIAGGLALAYASVAKPKYTADAQVLIENLESPFTRTQPTDSGDRRQIELLDVSSQVEVMQSRDLAKRVVEQLRLVDYPEFNPPTDAMSFRKRIMIALGFSTDPRLQTPQQRALAAYFDKVNVYQIPESRVIVIASSAGDPEIAAALANATADQYVILTRELQSEMTGRARSWLSEQIEDLRKKVVESEGAVEEFRSRAGLLRGGSAVTLSAQELSELNSQIILAAAQRSEAQAKAQAIRDLLARTGTVDGSSEALNSPLIQRLREQQIVLKRTLAELSTVYLDNHPRIIGARNELADLGRQVRAEALKLVEGLEQEAKVAAAREAALRASLAELKTRASEVNQDEVELRAREREAAANRTLLESFLGRFSDASARQQLDAQPGLARIIARADAPSQPAFPKLGPIVAIGLVGGLVIGLGLAFLAEVMSVANRAFGPVSGMAAAGGAAAASPARGGAGPDLAAGHGPEPLMPLHGSRQPKPRRWAQPPAGEPAVIAAARAGPPEPAGALEAAARWLLDQRRNLGVRRFAVAAHGGAEASAAAATVALARRLAAKGGRVIAIDASPHSRPLLGLFQLRETKGLTDLLAGQAAFSDVIVRDKASPAHVLGAGIAADGVPALAAGERMDVVLEALDHAYDIVLVHVGEIAYSELTAGGLVAKCQGGLLFAPQDRGNDAAIVVEQLRRLGHAAVRLVKVEAPQRGEGEASTARLAVNA